MRGRGCLHPAIRQIFYKDKDKIQCIVNQKINPNFIPFGQTQQPSLSDYADGVDTLQFLIEL